MAGYAVVALVRDSAVQRLKTQNELRKFRRSHSHSVCWDVCRL